MADALDADEVARIVGKSEDNARQLASRARRHVEERRPRFESSHEQREELARRFFAAARDGDVGSLESRSRTTWCCAATAALKRS